jgi:hypothetical protein
MCSLHLKTAKALSLTVASQLLERQQLSKAICGNVRFWHKADIAAVLIHVRFRG